jgi:hypothetical protein
MNKRAPEKLIGPQQVVRIGCRAYRVRTHVVVEDVDTSGTEAFGEVVEGADGSFELMLSEKDGFSIDKSEQAVLATCWPAMRAALAAHLVSVSKKSPK